ncbi:MAG: hypothetical protein JW782_08035 [Candidatus Saganbacteria bacterium]|nr:hypothetical protein [Candidatus Saganbacteria bacterium]
MSRVEKILKGIAKSERVAGAYLFIGPPNVGKKAAADQLAELLGCAKIDRVVVGPDGASVKIEQVRDLQIRVRFGPNSGKYLLATIERADTMTDQAAAAFLKTLEEPPPGVVFILLCEREDKLPATISSRCQRVLFPEDVVEWRPKDEWQTLCKELNSLAKKNTAELLSLSGKLAKEKERIEDVLYELASYSRYQLNRADLARIVLDTLRFIKRRANLRLALDVMCLKMGETNV